MKIFHRPLTLAAALAFVSLPALADSFIYRCTAPTDDGKAVIHVDASANQTGAMRGGNLVTVENPQGNSHSFVLSGSGYASSGTLILRGEVSSTPPKSLNLRYMGPDQHNFAEVIIDEHHYQTRETYTSHNVTCEITTGD